MVESRVLQAFYAAEFTVPIVYYWKAPFNRVKGIRTSLVSMGCHHQVLVPTVCTDTLD